MESQFLEYANTGSDGFRWANEELCQAGAVEFVMPSLEFATHMEGISWVVGGLETAANAFGASMIAAGVLGLLTVYHAGGAHDRIRASRSMQQKRGYLHTVMVQPPPIVITEALPQDAEAIGRVLAITWLHTYPNAAYNITQDDIKARFADPAEVAASIRAGLLNQENRRLWVAREGPQVIGSCTAYRNEEAGHIGAMYVLPDYQGRGIGARLMQEAIAWLGTQQEITLWAAVFNPRPIAFYQRFGFVENGVVREYALHNGKILPLLQMVKRPEG